MTTDVWEVARLDKGDNGVWPQKWLSWMAAHGVPADDAPRVTALYRDPDQRQVSYLTGHWRPPANRHRIQRESRPTPFPEEEP